MNTFIRRYIKGESHLWILLILFPLLCFFVARIFLLPEGSNNAHQYVLYWCASIFTFSLLIFFVFSSKDNLCKVIKTRQERVTRFEVFLLIEILIIAFLARLYRITDFPFYLHNDEMSCGLEALRVLSSPIQSPFETGWYAHPNIGFMVGGLFFKFFQNPILALRMNSVFFGTVSLFGTYLFARSFWGRKTAFVALALTVFFHFHLHFSRIGTHYMAAAAVSALTWGVFAYALTHRQALLYALAGSLFGFSLMLYSSALLNLVVLAIWIPLIVIRSSPCSKRSILKGGTLFVLSALIILAPMIKTWIQYPSRFNQRGVSVSILRPENFKELKTNYHVTTTIDVIYEQVIRSFDFFVHGGDTSLQYGFSGGIFDFVTAPLALLGFVIVVFGIRRSQNQFLLLMVVLTGILGGVLLDHPPFAPRYSGLAPFLMIFPALCLSQIFRIKNTILSWVGYSLICMAVVSSAYANAQYYFANFQETRVGDSRDQWIRLLLEHPEVKTLISTNRESENFLYESFKYATPNVTLVWLPSNLISAEDLMTATNNLPGPVMIVTTDGVCSVPNTENCLCIRSVIPRYNTCYSIVNSQ